MKYIKGIILFLTLFICCSCSDLQLTNPEYRIYYTYVTTIDYPYNRRYIPYRHHFHYVPRYRTYLEHREYRFRK